MFIKITSTFQSSLSENNYKTDSSAPLPVLCVLHFQLLPSHVNVPENDYPKIIQDIF